MPTSTPSPHWEQIGRCGTDPTGQPNILELPESGWGALVAWLSPPAWISCLPDEQQHYTEVRIVAEAHETRHREPRSVAEQDALDDDIDTYLRDAGADPRPRGYRWFLTLPPGLDADAFWARINSALSQTDPMPTHPREVGRVVQKTLDAIYAVS